MNIKKEGTTKRQARREEIRRKERRQRTIVLGSIAGIVLIILAAIILPNILGTNDGGTDEAVVEVTPVSYTNMDGTRLGDPNAPVKIEVFEDFQCPACQSYTFSYEPTIIQELVETGQAYYIFYQYPFLDDRSTSKDSDRAASASMCAADQNRFWDYKNLLYANSREAVGVFNANRLTQLAQSIGLDMDAFNACFDENRFQSEIDQHVQLGLQMGVSGTPSVFVNGQDVSPGKVPTFEQIRDAVLAAANQ